MGSRLGHPAERQIFIKRERWERVGVRLTEGWMHGGCRPPHDTVYLYSHGSTSRGYCILPVTTIEKVVPAHTGKSLSLVSAPVMAPMLKVEAVLMLPSNRKDP